MWDDADLRVVVERQVDVLVRDEVDRDTAAGGTANGEPQGAVPGRQEEERGRKHGSRAILGVAEEAPRPLTGQDLPDGEVRELRRDLLEPCGRSWPVSGRGASSATPRIAL